MGKDCPTAPPARCGNCRKHDHWIDECPEPLVCPRCQGSHRLRDCEEPVKCHRCGGEHMARECPDYVPTCNNCGETGEFEAAVISTWSACVSLADCLSLARTHRIRMQKSPQDRS